MRPSSNSISNKNGNGKYDCHPKKNYHNFRRANFNAMLTEFHYQTFEQPIVRNNAEQGFEILKNRVNDARRRHIPRRRVTVNNPPGINNYVKQAIGNRQRAYEAKRIINSKETVAEYSEAKRQVKRIVKHEKRIRNSVLQKNL